MPKNLLATLDDGRLLTGGAKDGATELLTWPPSGGLPTVVLRLPGERSPYDLSEALVSVIDPIWTPSLMTTEGSPGPLVQVIQNEGKTVALFHREPVLDINGDVLLPGSMTVVALDAAGTPRYLHSIQPAPKFAELVGGPDTNVYLVDASHQRVTALTWP